MRDFFAAFGGPDEARLRELLHEQAVWHYPGTSPIAGDWPGVTGLLTGIRAIAMQLGDGHNGFELLDVLANEHGAVTIHRDYYQGPGNHFDQRFAVYARIEHGRITEAWEIPFDLPESDRYFGQQARAILGRRPASKPKN